MVGGRINHYTVCAWRCYCLPLAAIELEIQGKPVLVNAACSIGYSPTISPGWN